MLIFLIFNSFSYAQEDLDNAIKKLADKISRHITDKKKTKIAVIPFQNLKTDVVSTFGKYIAEELTTALFNSGKFEIIERNLLNKILDELKLSQTGAVDPSSAKELGKITGVNAIVTGTIQDLINRVAVNCRLIETETGNIFAAASVKIIKDETITKIIEDVIQDNLKIEKEKEIKGPLTYDMSRYIIERISSLRVHQDIDFKYSFDRRRFRLEFLSVTINKSILIKSFFVQMYRMYGKYVAFTFPKITDNEGNTYLASKVFGDIRRTRCDRGNCFKVFLPKNGRAPVFFEFPLISKTANKVWFTLNKQSLEIDWEDVLRNPIN
jgi:TolB-like protein